MQAYCAPRVRRWLALLRRGRAATAAVGIVASGRGGWGGSGGGASGPTVLSSTRVDLHV